MSTSTDPRLVPNYYDVLFARQARREYVAQLANENEVAFRTARHQETQAIGRLIAFFCGEYVLIPNTKRNGR